MNRKPKLLYVTAHPITQWAFLRGQNAYMAERGFELHSIASPDPILDKLVSRDGVIPHPIFISRRITPLRDILSLIQLYLTIRHIAPDIIHFSTPKAALLGAIAAWLARVPNRLFVVRGIHTESATGTSGRIFRLAEALTAKFSTHCICVSPSLLSYGIEQGILAAANSLVVANGMSNGIDTDRFAPSAEENQFSRTIGFVGRLAADKGIKELAEAWQGLRDDFPTARLLLVGPWDEEAPVDPQVRRRLEDDSRVEIAGFVNDTLPYYKRMSLFVYPSHGTEGFPNAPMEAAAMELPMIATCVIGNVDAVIDGVTGTLIPPRDTVQLAEALRDYLNQPELGRSRGKAGRERVIANFQCETVWQGWHAEYQSLLRRHANQGWYHKYGKRLLDLVGAGVGLTLLSPVILLLAVLIRFRLGSPILFRQVRPGRDGTPFALYKFRTMTDTRDKEGTLLPDSKRLTGFGRRLRAASLDELPELFNVLRGEMSLVGPRPLLVQYLDRYTPEQARRHEVRPGLTGWAQVNGRNNLTWEEKFALDVWYVDHKSLWLDLKILMLTVLTVMGREGVNQQGFATAEEFMGNYSEGVKQDA